MIENKLLNAIDMIHTTYTICSNNKEVIRLKNNKNGNIRSITYSTYKRSKKENRKLRKPIKIIIDDKPHLFTFNEWTKFD